MIKLPWTNRTCPHFVLEISRRCDIRCKGCYKILNGSLKSVEEVEKDIDTAVTLREIQTVSIVGGEPLLHPELTEIIKLIRRRKLKVALITNGRSLSDHILNKLSSAGLNIIMFHIDEGQQRDDLSQNASIEEIETLRDRLTKQAVQSGIDVGLSITIFPEHIDRLPRLIDYVLRSHHIHYLFATNFFDFDGKNRTNRLHLNTEILEVMKDYFNIDPFAYAGEIPLWLLYCIPVAYNGDGYNLVHLRRSWLKKFMVGLPRVWSGKNTFYMGQNQLINRCIVALNTVADAFIIKGNIWIKQLVFENGPVRREDGKWGCISVCPNSTIRNGKLAHICFDKQEVT